MPSPSSDLERAGKRKTLVADKVEPAYGKVSFSLILFYDRKEKLHCAASRVPCSAPVMYVQPNDN